MLKLSSKNKGKIEMKRCHFLYSLGVLAVVGVLACFLVSATGTFPERFRKQQLPVETRLLVRSQKKKCGCCKQSMDLIQKRIQQAGKRKRGLQKTEGTDTEASLVSLVPQKPRGVSLAEWLRSLSRKELEAVYCEKPWLKPVHEMTFEEREAEIARSQQQLIDTFGNTPEVAILNKYTSQEIHEGKGFTIPAEDAAEYLRAMSVLWPTPDNVASYENLKALEQKGWHVD